MGTFVSTRRSLNLLAVLVVISSVVSACSGGSSISGNGGASPSRQASAASPSSTAGQENCADITGEQALEEAKPHISYQGSKPYDGGVHGWDFQHFKPYKDFDPCKDISYIHLHQGEANNDAATFVALFHRGHFVSMLRQEPVGYISDIEPIDDKTLKVTFADKQKGRDVDSSTRQATSIYKWNNATRAVERTGDLIDPNQELPAQSASPASTQSASPSATAPVVGAYSGAGGPVPVGAVPITTTYSNDRIGGSAVVVTSPTRNIGCDFTEDVATTGCGVLSLAGKGDWWVNIARPVADTSVKDGPDFFEQPDSRAQVLEYGQVGYWGKYVCASEQAGMTCWNTETKHGAFMNRDGITTF